MDPWVLKLNTTGGGDVAVEAAKVATCGSGRKRVTALRQGGCWRRAYAFGCRVLVVGPSVSGRWERKLLGHRPLEVRATGKNKGHEGPPSPGGGKEPSIPEGDGTSGSNSISGETKHEDSLTQKSHHLNLDWRTFRATLVAQEKGPTKETDGPSEELVPGKPSSGLGSKWAHPIPVPEAGCVLIATDKLDGVRNFERTVVLLLRVGTMDNGQGPFGVILNRPLHKKIKHMKPTNHDLSTTFADCSLHFGGPLDASIFLVRTGENSSPPSLEQVVPGVCVGARNSLNEVAGLVKKGVCHPKDFRFFVGYAGWQLDQLREEIESDYWIVAACSSDLIGSAALESSSGLWVEILQLMGGPYSDLSRKEKEDDKS
uniref:UPF0301 protein Cag_1601 n=1 Tax=Anthurium amnicola TaxID=1678845 RepID=A0A1D1ZEC5_9ARAE